MTNTDSNGTAVPHRATQDDVYDGYFIPKGSLLIPNLWYVMHDPTCLTRYAHDIPALGNSRTIRVYTMIRSSSSPSGFLLIFLQQKGWGDRWNLILEKRVSGLEGGMSLEYITWFLMIVEFYLSTAFAQVGLLTFRSKIHLI